MIIKNTIISGLKIIKSKNYYDNRGLFREVFKNKVINKLESKQGKMYAWKGKDCIE